MKKIRLYAGPQDNTAAPRFWNMASTGEDSGEIVLYGDVLSQKPRNWWTGEEKKGLYITPEGFMEDLEIVKGKRNITIKINSCGGDLYSGIAIHNAIKALKGYKTVIIEGIAASAASAIACAGDEVHVYPGSIFMIHGVSAMLFDYYSKETLEKALSAFEAGEKALAEIYRERTGKDMEALRKLMKDETWYIGQEIVDSDFADKLLEGKKVETSISADHNLLFVAGAQHNIEGFRNIPSRFQIKNAISPESKAENREKTVEKEGVLMTRDELKNKYPDLVAEIVAEAEEGERMKERQRIQDIEQIQAGIGDEDLIKDAKFGKESCTAETLAYRAMKKQAALGRKFLADVAEDSANSGVDKVMGLPSGRKEDEPDESQMVTALVNEYKALMKGENA